MFQTTEQEWKAAGTHLYGHRFHGAQCSRADGQLRGECLPFEILKASMCFNRNRTTNWCDDISNKIIKSQFRRSKPSLNVFSLTLVHFFYSVYHSQTQIKT